MDFQLKDKTAIVAGGGRGIGKAIARELAREGVDVVIASRTLTELKFTADELSAETGRRIVPVAFDVTNRDQVDQAISQAADILGSIHILVNSASLPGGSPSATGPIESVNDTDLLSDFDVKYVGALRCARSVIPFMKTQEWGRIINISGGNARVAGNLSGGARNVALVHLTKTLSTQLGRYGITVNCIHPGVTRTERTQTLLDPRAKELGISVEQLERLDFAPDSSSGNAICRMVEASEIGFLTAFLASDKAWAVTGEVITAGGGIGNAVYY